ncbi:hypothetical protein PIB30_104599 [Stylosanthes scabra]|uniref:Uncharacterized protein n=1 Tax=Stylosanthes scabra TaxID=79078 RepID=A0ABU6SYK3_9FABA|nr:hypothetical protein [Stylosanthes scabra]
MGADKLVPEPPSRRPIAVISMQSLLRQACDRIHRPDPIFRTVKNTLPDGRVIFRHVVSFVPADCSEALPVTSRLSFNPNLSRDDAARLALRLLSRLQHGFVDDYNYDLVQRWKARYTEVATVLQNMQEMVDSLLRRNDELAKSIDPQKGCSSGVYR